MIISKETMDILYNFSTINQNIYIKPGNVLKTKNVLKTVFAEAEIKDVFTKEFAIHNLKQLLSVISTFHSSGTNGCDITFQEDKMLITSAGKYAVEYPYADPETVESVDKNLHIVNPILNFSIDEEDITKISTLGSIFGLNMLTIEGNTSTNQTTVYYRDIKTNLTPRGSLDLFIKPPFNYKVNIPPENWKMIRGGYNITVSKNPVPMCKLDHKTLPIKYCIGLHHTSEFND